MNQVSKCLLIPWSLNKDFSSQPLKQQFHVFFHDIIGKKKECLQLPSWLTELKHACHVQKLSVLEVESFNMNYLKKIGFNIMRGFRNMTSETRTAKNTEQPFLCPPGISRESFIFLSAAQKLEPTEKKDFSFCMIEVNTVAKKNVWSKTTMHLNSSSISIDLCLYFLFIFLSASVSRDDRTLNGANKKEHKKIFSPREKLRKNPA